MPMSKPKHIPKIEETVWDFKKITKDIYTAPELIEDFDPDNEDSSYTPIYNGYEYWGD